MEERERIKVKPTKTYQNPVGLKFIIVFSTVSYLFMLVMEMINQYF